MASKHTVETHMVGQLQQTKLGSRYRGVTYRRILRCFERFQVMLHRQAGPVVQ